MKCFAERPVSLLVAIVVGGLLLVSCSSLLTPTATPTLQLRVESTLPLAELWCFQSDAPVPRSIFSEGLLFTLNGQTPKVTHRVYHAENGTLAWEGTSDNEAGRSGLLGYWLVSSLYLIVGDGASLTVLDASTGAFQWRIEPWLRGFATDGERLFVGSPEKIRAYELSSGNLLWEIEGQGRGWSRAPLYDPFTNLLVFDEAIDVESNEIIHARSIAAYTQKWEPAIIGDIMLVSDINQVVAFHIEEFVEVWL